MELLLSSFDPDFDRPQRQLPDDPRSFTKRLVVNPFLVVIDWLAAFAILRASIERHNRILFQIGAGVLLLGLLLLQYHCLDCGKTGWVLRQGRHDCPDDVAGWRERRSGRLGVPSIRAQIVIWCVVLGIVVFFWLLLTDA